MAAMTKSKDALCFKFELLVAVSTTAAIATADITTEDTIVYTLRYATASTAAPISETTFSITAAGFVQNSATVAVGDRIGLFWLDNSA